MFFNPFFLFSVCEKGMTSEYVVATKRSPTAILLLLLIIMNAVSVFTAVTYYQKVADLEKQISTLTIQINVLSRNVYELQQSYKPVTVAFDYYVKIMMARIIAEMYNVSIVDAMKMIEKYYNISR